MSMPRKYLSGCQKRKLAEKKKEVKQNLKKSRIILDSWLQNKSDNDIATTSSVAIQASTGEENSKQVTQLCHENIETVDFVEKDAYDSKKILATENNDENDNNVGDPVNINDQVCGQILLQINLDYFVLK